MFRNFVNPPALDRDGIRPSLPPDAVQQAYNSHPGHTAPPYPNPAYTPGANGQNSSTVHNHHGIPNGYPHNHMTSQEALHQHAYASAYSSQHSGAYSSQHSEASIVQSSDVARNGGGYTTSIFVNGGGGGATTSRESSVTGAYHYPSNHQNAHSSSQKHPHAHSSASYNGQNSATPCPQSPHPGTHSTHAYTPINSANVGLAALSIKEDDGEVQQQQQQISRSNEFSTQLKYAALNLTHRSHHQYGENNNSADDNKHFHTGNGISHSRRQEEHGGGNGFGHHQASLYPIVDELEEEDDDEYGNGGGKVERASSHNNLSNNQSNHVNNNNSSVSSASAVPGQEYSQRTFNVIPPTPPSLEHIFAGRRDVRDPKSVSEKQIVSAKGTVRGFKNRVKAGIATFWAEPEDKRNYRSLEQGKIVIYATSMCVVRGTSERCKTVRSLLQNHMVRYEERDLYMSREIQQELKHRLAQEGMETIRLPHVFADGIRIGGAEELERLNEAGELRALLNNYQKIAVRFMCEGCGGYRFTPCEICHGSKRSLIRNHFTEEFCALRCMHCNESGLRRCELCKDQQE